MSDGDFQLVWGPAGLAGWSVDAWTPPAVCGWNGSAYVFYVPGSTFGIRCIRVSGAGTIDLPTLPLVGTSGPLAAAVMGGQIAVAYPARNTVSVLTSADGQTWASQANVAGIATGVYNGIAMCEVDGTQYVMYTTGIPPGNSSLLYVMNSGDDWSQPIAVPNSGHGWSPALATDGQTLFVAFQYGSQGIYTGRLTATGWTGPSSRSGILTNGQVSLGYLAGTLYLSYWGIDSRPHWETWDPAHQTWSDQNIAVTSTGPVIVTGLAGQPSLIFKQGPGAGQPGTLSWSTVTGATGSPVASLGLFASDTPPVLVPYGGATCALSTIAGSIWMHAFDGANWSAPAPVTIFQAGPGRLGADVSLGNNGAQTLWLAAAQPDGTVSAATFDGTDWTALPEIMPPGSGQGGAAIAVYDGSVYGFWEGGQRLYWSVYDAATDEWIKGGDLPAIGWAASTSVTVAGDVLYVGYICADPRQNTGRIYTAAFDGDTWAAPVSEGTDTATAVTIGCLGKTLVMVFLGTDGNLYAQWSSSGGTSWNGKVKLGPASTAPGLAPITTGADDDSDQALLAVAGSSTPGYTGEYCWQMTTPTTSLGAAQ